MAGRANLMRRCAGFSRLRCEPRHKLRASPHRASSLFGFACELAHPDAAAARLTSDAEIRDGGYVMLDLATRKELAALAYERAETENEQDPIFMTDDGEANFASTRRWYDTLLLPASTLV